MAVGAVVVAEYLSLEEVGIGAEREENWNLQLLFWLCLGRTRRRLVVVSACFG